VANYGYTLPAVGLPFSHTSAESQATLKHCSLSWPLRGTAGHALAMACAEALATSP
jgi:hypothetical protein